VHWVLAEHIQDVFQDGSDFGATIEYSKETAHLITAGDLMDSENEL
jgi:NDP-sugar pyrophosphorylase family protein